MRASRHPTTQALWRAPPEMENDNDADNLMDQMDQPATPSRTAAAIASPCVPDGPEGPDGPDNVPSPEPPSTRPNPFDDSDLSARKRRRTSGSVSASPPPSTSASTNVLASASASASTSAPASASASARQGDAEDKPSLKHFGTNATAPDQQPIAAAMAAGEKLELPHTPKTPTDSAKSSPTPLSSNKVTINLRKAVDTDLATAGSISSSLNDEEAPPVVSDTTSPDQAEVITGDQPQRKSGDNTSQMSDSASPPVELVAISDNENGESDDEMAFSVDDKATGILHSELLPLDPTLQFPYIHQNEEPSLPLLRIINHFRAGELSYITISVQPQY